MLLNMLNPEPTSTGIRSGNRVIGYSSAIRLLDNGRYDKHLVEGMELLACIMEAVESNWITLNIEKQIIVWRWLLAAVFITEEREKNGTVEVPNDEGGVDIAVIYSGEHGAISVYPGPERFALANHIEAGAIEKYGREEGLPLALRMYQDMVVCDDEYGFRLSAMGREGFNMLHDGFIEQIHTEGMPDMPVMH
ncbi:2-polyprenylphenol hydroxylase related flavodoxin oxidoreductase [Raoultella planticola]|uniref:2-polyprenylphenol hydroxylase related flavodoxin oxidoreductase n=2 Tax=Raoultella planticola TaxID=575 RepID=A0A8G2A1K7_RAOPL|nr:2-polyprenylphenol hydroxylase related flavodoxin oxidoreductase [Raoultella planticola]